MKQGNELATRSTDWERFKGFMMIDNALTKANVELLLLKRLNYVSLWTTLKAMVSTGDDKGELRKVKVRHDSDGDANKTGATHH